MKDLLKNTIPYVPYNLQFFATDPGDEGQPTPNPEPTPTPQDDPQPTPEPKLSIEEEMALMKAELARSKKAVDKATADASEWKKKFRSTLDEKTKLDEDRIERESQREQEFQLLKRESQVNKMSKSFLTLGYSDEEATKASEAQIDNDFDEFMRIQKTVQERRDKSSLANYMKSMPTPPTGNKDTDKPDPFLSGFKM